MGLKTFNLDEEVYKRYSSHCKREGISMSKRVEKFMREDLSRLTNVETPKEMKNPEANNSKALSGDHPMHKFC